MRRTSRIRAMSAVAVCASLGVVAAAARADVQRTCVSHTASTELEAVQSIGGGVRDAGRARRSGFFAVAADAAVTFPLSDALRVGPWLRLATSFRTFDPATGLHVVLAPTEVRWFDSPGRAAFGLDLGAGLAFRGGRPGETFGNQPFAIARLAFGFRAPLRLYHLYPESCSCGPEPQSSDEEWSCRPGSGMVSGLRIYASVSRTLDPPTVWEVSFGLEFEPLGSTWWLFSR